MSGTALPTDGRSRFVVSDRTGRPWITLFVLRGVHASGTGSECLGVRLHDIQPVVNERWLTKSSGRWCVTSAAARRSRWIIAPALAPPDRRAQTPTGSVA